MATDQTNAPLDHRVLLISPDTAATRYLFSAAAWLALGSLAWLGTMLAMRFPGLLPLGFGRLRPMALIALELGWLVLGLAAAIFYLLPRLTGAPLALEKQLNRALPLAVLVVGGGMIVVALGWGDGREPFALPWWWDLGVLALTALALGPTMLTLAVRPKEWSTPRFGLPSRRRSGCPPSMWPETCRACRPWPWHSPTDCSRQGFSMCGRLASRLAPPITWSPKLPTSLWRTVNWSALVSGPCCSAAAGWEPPNSPRARNRSG